MMQTEKASKQTTAKRLPVNPRRHKVAPEQRKRVATACNSCNVRRIKCSGEKPCRQCRGTSRDCTYPVAVEKVSVSRAEFEELQRRCAALEKCLREAVPDEARRQRLLSADEDGADAGSSNGSIGTPATSATGRGGGSSAASTTATTAPASLPSPDALPVKTEAPGDDAAHHRFPSLPSASPPDAPKLPQNPINLPLHPATPAPADGTLLQDSNGNARFRGESSGATFLDHLKDFMITVFPLAFHEPWQSKAHNGAFLAPLGGTSSGYHHHLAYNDPRPFHVPVVDPLWLPPRAEMAFMLSELRCFIQDGHGDYASGGIYWWGDLGAVPSDPVPLSVHHGGHGDMLHAAVTSPPDLDKYRHLAFYHTAFAVFCHAGLINSPAAPPEAHASEAYFARARLLLGNPLDIARYNISDVAVLALMGFYLVEMNRRDAAYMYVGVAAHISIMHGAHRGWVDERGKRVFWTLYILDRWLSCLLGRPHTIQDESIRLPLPCDAPGLPPAAGLRAHVELSRISGHIVCNTYRTAPWDDSGLNAKQELTKALGMLDSWLSNLPPVLQMVGDQFSTDPGTCSLHMAYNQLVILAIRPMYFATVKRSFAVRWVSRRDSIESSEVLVTIRRCANAARRNLRIARWTGRVRRLLQAALHHIFSAAIVLMLQEMVCTNLALTDIDDIQWTVRVFEDEARTGNSYARDCAKVLTDMRELVVRLKAPFEAPLPSVVAPQPPVLPEQQQQQVMTDPSSGMPAVNIGQSVVTEPIMYPGVPWNFSEGDALYQELVAWMEFDEMQMYNNYMI